MNDDYARELDRVLRYAASGDHAVFHDLINNGHDLTPRKAYADYLDDNGGAAPGVPEVLRHHEGPLTVRTGDDGLVRVSFKKRLRVGTAPTGRTRRAIVINVEYTPEGELSLSGSHGGSGGQINMGFAHRDPKHDDTRYSKPLQPRDIKFEPGWNREKWLDLLDVWRKWHLNRLRAGTPEQEAYLEENPVHAVYPESHYEKASQALADAGLNPHNGYVYGSKWLKEEVPGDVLAFLAKLPEAK